MARSIAILLMLEGHFVHHTLHNFASYEAAGTYPLFEAWSFVRGFTSTVFLTVTGLVFSYLLLKKSEEPYFSNSRVKKGFRRVAELLVWGYLLQPTAFHVLQCIGVSIFAILAIYGLHKVIRIVPLWICFLATGISVFYLQTSFIPLQANLQADPNYGFPESAPHFIQNMIFASPARAVFPLIPSMGFVLLGAMLGCLLHDLHNYIRTWTFALSFVAAGAMLYFWNAAIFSGVDTLAGSLRSTTGNEWQQVAWLFEKFGMVVIILGALMLVEKSLGRMETNLFLKIGQNTLMIFILHFIVLYWNVNGIGLGANLHNRLNPSQAALGAVLFIGLFVLLVQHLEEIQERLTFLTKAVHRTAEGIFSPTPQDPAPTRPEP